MLNDRWKVRPNILIGVLLIVATLGVYWNVLTFSFINLDDPDYVSYNSRVQDGLSLQNVTWAFTTVELGTWHPLTWLSLMLDYRLYHLNAGGYHCTNLILHIASTLLLFISLKRMTNARWPSAFVAALFALHPLHVESVAWVSERKDVLSAFFWMLTISAYAYYAERSSRARYALILVSYTLGLMSKPMLVTLPLVLLLLDYWPLNRYPSSSDTGSEKNTINTQKGLSLLTEKLPLFFLSFVFSLLAYYSQSRSGAITPISVELRISNAVVSYTRYLGKTIWPQDLAVFYPSTGTWTLWETSLPLSLIIAVIFLCLMGFRRYPYLMVGWLWYVVTLAPVSGIIQIGYQSLADRYTYIPLIGIFIMFTWGSIDVLKRQSYSIQRVIPLYAIILFVLMLVTCIQVQYWKDSKRLFTHALEVTHDNFVANGSLGLAYLDTGDLARADYYLREALRINPRYAVAYQNLGRIDYRLKKWDAAAAHFRESLKWESNFINKAKGHNNLGVSLLMKGNIDEAMDEFKNAIEVNPDLERAKLNLKNAYILKERKLKRN